MIAAKFTADFDNFNTEVVKAEKQLNLFEGTTVTTSKAVATMATTTATSAPKVSDLSSAYKQFDGVLQAAGVNVGAQVKGLEDIAAAATNAAGGLSTFVKGGLVVGTMLEGWKIGRAIAEYFQLDQAISEAAASIGSG